jgi:hypothetical protein
MAQPLSCLGFADVSLPPFNADPTGATDATVALQRAVDFARWHYLAVYIPAGTYTVTDTLVLRQGPRLMQTGDIPGPLPRSMAPHAYLPFSADFLLDGVSSRYVPHYVRGQLVERSKPSRATSNRSETSEDAGQPPPVLRGRAVLRVPAHTRAFSSVAAPRVVVDMHYTNPMGATEPNAQYNTGFTGIDIVIGVGNAGAIGARLRGAQGAGLEDVTVVFEGGRCARTACTASLRHCFTACTACTAWLYCFTACTACTA